MLGQTMTTLLCTKQKRLKIIFIKILKPQTILMVKAQNISKFGKKLSFKDDDVTKFMVGTTNYGQIART